MDADPRLIANEWLSTFTAAIGSNDYDALAQTILVDGWLRDILVFTWDIRSLEGRDRIASYLSITLSSAAVSAIKLDDSPFLAPRSFELPLKQASGVEAAFTFECAHGRARGNVRILPDVDGNYKAFTLMTELFDLPGHEEQGTLPLRDDLTGIPGRDMQQEFADWVKKVESNPYALIVGGGQTALQLAARFKQMDIPALVIERNHRIGDSWRKRYPSLTLHTIRRHHSLLYQSYPSNWPQFTPRDKMADWLEQYAAIQDLVVWTDTELKERPVYRPETKDWDVSLIREGFEVKLNPAHIVLATGTLGEPYIPDIPDVHCFQGHVMHSQEFGGGAPYAGKKAVVIGAGNSSIDICQDLVLRGAGSVTMIQRSSTCVLTREYVAQLLRSSFPEDVPLSIADFKWASFPVGLLRKLMIADQQSAWDANKELHDKLRKGGFKVSMGPDGQGVYILTMERAGGASYFLRLDKGGADLIADGRIKVRSGVSPQRFTESSLVLSDGSELAADVVIFATGFKHMREANRETFGSEVIDQTDEVYGLDEEGEIKGSYRPSGYPGLWFATGDFFVSRFMSKALALQLKAIQLGLLEHDGRRPSAKSKV
ncbi:FAD/NAD-P-binding domain-containing protein [Trametes coccinea BRFM310]|uniref:FAD/NAD-P-binding domain-containing protein n=1 Tax=Trametes coccinea (strain BRFM310) TaxID=1353009 RepID=A0A1Y2I840_TRAC3|nr:FAD/NAD-P-binding domain-containing protein [Trametes coccinea BRFM310]